MQYLIMITMVIGLACADIITGWIKAHVNDDYSSKVMRKGGLNKIGELIVMCTACGLEFGINQLGRYYEKELFASITGTLAAVAVLIYIVIMEGISILENVAEANPDMAGWIMPILRKLRSFTENKEGAESKTENNQQTETTENKE